MFISSKLRTLRKQHKLTLFQLAHQLANQGLNISICSLSKWERGLGLPKTDKIEALAKFYELPIQFFFADGLTNKESVSSSKK